MPTLKAEFSGGATGETINNPLVGQASLPPPPPPSGAEDGEGKDGEEGGGGDEGSNSGNKQEHTVILFNISDDTNKYDNDIGKLKSDIIDELSQNTQISKNEIGYGISVALEPTTGLVRNRKPQYIGITLDLTHLNLKTGKEPEEIFETCRKIILINLQKLKK